MSRFRVITVARQYGSGGGPIARLLAKQLGWSLLDQALITKVARAAQVDPGVCAQYDEAVDSWLHSVAKRAFGNGAFEGATTSNIFDADAAAELSRQMIVEAAEMGNCVIVGRGGQCALRGRSDVFHIYVYAPIDERIRRLKEHFGPAQAKPELILSSDKERAAYVKHHYGCEWCSPLLYDAMFNSTLGDEAVAAAVLTAMQLVPQRA